MAAIFMLVAGTLIVTAMKLISSTSRESKLQELNVAEAENVAKAGLVDALGWYRRKGVVVRSFNNNYVIPGTTPTYTAPYTHPDQPFEPQYNVNAAQSDTIDASIGIVSEYPLDVSSTTTNAVFFARYEVIRQDPQHPNPTETSTPWTTPTKTSTPNPNAVHDVSGNRVPGLWNGDGLVWQVQSTGYVFRRNDPSKAFNVWPNKVVATARVMTELRKMQLNLPVTTGGVTLWGAIYSNATTMVSLVNDNTLLNGAVSVSGTYAVVGMNPNNATPTPPPTPTFTYTPTSTYTPSAVAAPVTAYAGSEVAPITEGTQDGRTAIWTTNSNSGSKTFAVTINNCGTYKITANVDRESSAENTWDVQVGAYQDTTGRVADDFDIGGTSDTWQTLDVTGANGGGGTRNWRLPRGVLFIKWSGVDANAYLEQFTVSFIATSTCINTHTPTQTPTSTNTPQPTFTPNPVCALPSGSTVLNEQGSTLCHNDPTLQLLLDTYVFGMSLQDVGFIADYYGDSSRSLPVSFSSMKLIYYNGDLAYGAALASPYQRLYGTGILVVNGNLTLNGGNGSTILPSSFAGVVFVTGNLVIADGSEIDGAVIMGHTSSGGGGTVTLDGVAGNRGTIYLNPGLVNRAMQLVAQYRENVTARKTLLAIPNL